MVSFYKAYFARWSYLRSSCGNKKELGQEEECKLINNSTKSQLKAAPEKAELFGLSECKQWTPTMG